MKPLRIALLMLLVAHATIAHASTASFTAALEAGDVNQVRALLAPTIHYTRLGLVGGGKLSEQSISAGRDLPFWHEVDEVEMVDGALRLTTEDGFVEQWEMWADTSGGAITQITEIAMEGAYPGAPDGCPDTSLRRREVATLHGPLGPYPQVTVRIMKTARNTDAWAFTEKKSCQPTPGKSFEDLEVIAQDSAGQIVGYQHVGRRDLTVGGHGEGIGLFNQMSGGALISGGAHLYTLGGQGYLFLARSWHTPDLSGESAAYQVTQYALQGKSLKPVWAFDFGEKRGGEQLLWSLSAPGADGSISARVESGTARCPGGQSMQLTWNGRGFAEQKSGVPGGCLSSRWPGGEGGILSRGESNLEAIAKKADAQHQKAEKKAGPVITSVDDEEDDTNAPNQGEVLIH